MNEKQLKIKPDTARFVYVKGTCPLHTVAYLYNFYYSLSVNPSSSSSTASAASNPMKSMETNIKKRKKLSVENQAKVVSKVIKVESGPSHSSSNSHSTKTSANNVLLTSTNIDAKSTAVKSAKIAAASTTTAQTASTAQTAGTTTTTQTAAANFTTAQTAAASSTPAHTSSTAQTASTTIQNPTLSAAVKTSPTDSRYHSEMATRPCISALQLVTITQDGNDASQEVYTLESDYIKCMFVLYMYLK